MKRNLIFVLITALLLTGCSGNSEKKENTQNSENSEYISGTVQTTDKDESKNDVSDSSDVTTNNKPVEISPEEILEEDIYDLPGFVVTEAETLPVTAITVDETNDEYNIMNIAKYVSTGKTDLAITDIKVFSNSKPGVENIGSFKSGDTLLINLWCNTAARLDSVLYIVPEKAEHKDTYKPIECLYTYEMFSALESGEGQLFFEITLPENIASGNYELRFVCGTEEGYIPFHFGG